MSDLSEHKVDTNNYLVVATFWERLAASRQRMRCINIENSDYNNLKKYGTKSSIFFKSQVNSQL
jgi:hypothetical protein